MFKASKFLYTQSAWVSMIFAINILIVLFYILVALDLVWLLLTDLQDAGNALLMPGLVWSLTMVISASLISAFLAIVFFYSFFFQREDYLRLRVHDFLMGLSRVPHILLGSLVLAIKLPLLVQMLLVLVLFMMPRAYQFCTSHLGRGEASLVEMARSFSATRADIFFRFILRPNLGALASRLLVIAVQALCLLVPFFCLLSHHRDSSWATWQMFLSLSEDSQVPAGGLMLLLIAYSFVFFLDRGQAAQDWRYA